MSVHPEAPLQEVPFTPPSLLVEPEASRQAEIVTPEAVELPKVQLLFTGSGAEYFRIWAVNLALTVCTLGVYGPWAKVRRLQYFYQHTLLDGSAFDYTANPVAILFGRVLALGLLVGYYLALGYSAHAGLAATMTLGAVLPYLLWQSNRFKARNTRFRGLEFGFEGSLRGAYVVYVPVIVIVFAPSVIAGYLLGPNGEFWSVLLSMLSLLVLPVFHAMFRQYVQKSLKFGNASFEFTATRTDFMQVWAWGVGGMIAIFLISAFFVFTFAALLMLVLGKGGASAWVGVALTWGFAWLLFLLMRCYFTARFQRLVWDKTKVGELALHCQVSARGLMKVQCVNTLWVIVSLGLYRPFAAIRLAKFRLECVQVSVLESLNAVAVGTRQSRRGAMGDHAAELFDMDVAL